MKKVFPTGLIGEEILVIESPNKALVGMEGKIIDETKSTLKIEQQGKIKTLLKSAIIFRIRRIGQVVDGKSIAKKPEDRLK